MKTRFKKTRYKTAFKKTFKSAPKRKKRYKKSLFGLGFLGL